MATIVNTPTAPTSESNGMGFLLGAVLLIVVALVLVYAFVPALRGAAGQNAAPQNPGTSNGDGGTSIQVPDKIDVNLNQENPQQ